MKRSFTASFTPSSAALAACIAFVLLTGCGSGHGAPDSRPSASGGGGGGVPQEPSASRAPAAGKGSKDPDDLNGDGHRDLLVPVAAHVDPDTNERDERVGVVFGSARGLDPATRAVYGRSDLGIPLSKLENQGSEDSLAAESVTTADLDGDGFPDLVTTVTEDTGDGSGKQRNTLYVVWGTPTGPDTRGRQATRLQPHSTADQSGLYDITRGDFDGDGHHDLAGLGDNGTKAHILYGPFGRSGAPARTGSLRGNDGGLSADAIDPTGTPRVTGLLAPSVNDGEQAPSTLYADPRTGQGRELRAGNAHAFGDFDGDGRRDVAVGDNGSRNDEPGSETEAADVDGSLTVYPGGGGPPVPYKLPAPGKGRQSDYGPGGYVAADPDGDGRDGILVATYAGATLIDGEKRTPVLRQGPAEIDHKKRSDNARRARPAGAADFDADGRDELILAWAADDLFTLYGEHPTHWWITAGTSGRNATSFATTGFVS
ncbi:FG-GAP repeat domain-containing protein [Streptomyces sp. NPDC002795]|uniref:FG-GAP repeat domain-containing protein n=1 Tax=Streptomyces sp. NPDC002795 TaxID=3364665 RepID=UPI0036AEFEB1